MKQYLLDTNICIYYLKGLFRLDKKIQAAGNENCFLSEITLAELKFGAENSGNPVKNRKVVLEFQKMFTILPIFNALDLYAKEKARLRKKGKPLDDFDLLIGTSAVAYDLTLVTNNISDFERIDGIRLPGWTA